MFKYLLVWFLANYTYENMNDTYKSYKRENPIREMSEFIQYQQYREDQLRKQCNLQYHYIDPPRTIYDNMINYVKESLTFPKLLFYKKSYKTLINKINYKPIIYMEVLRAQSLEELLNLSYNSVNIGKNLVLEDVSYTLLQNGVKDSNVYNYANQMHSPTPRNPTWSTKQGNHTLTITNIKNNE